MIIENNGIRLNVTADRGSVVVRVERQSDEATKLLKRYTQVQDNETGYILRSNLRPSYNRNTKKIFIRGGDRTKDNDPITIPTRDPDKTIRGLRNLLALVVPVEQIQPDELEFQKGSTAHLRMRFINRRLATKLKLTNHKHYPIDCIDWEKTKPISVEGYPHYNEHIAQGIDVLNKTIGGANPSHQYTTNPHFVTPEQARNAVRIMEEAIQKAEELGCEIAWWRLKTAFRSIDKKNLLRGKTAAHQLKQQAQKARLSNSDNDNEE